MHDKPKALPCVLIPVLGGNLLLPNVSIAEVVDYAEADAPAGAPSWLLGQLSWRGISLPLISYDAANGGAPVLPQTHRGRIAVLNTADEQHGKLPFLAIVTQGIPRQTKVEEAVLTPGDGSPGPADLSIVAFAGELARIPNLEYLKQLVAEHSAA